MNDNLLHILEHSNFVPERIEAAREELAETERGAAEWREYQEHFKRVMEDNTFKHDHCPCVPMLMQENESLRQRFEALRLASEKALGLLQSTTMNWQEECLFDCNDVLGAALHKAGK